MRHADSGSAPPVVEYDLHGLVGIRLIDPSPGDVIAVSTQLGGHGVLARDADLTITFSREVVPRHPVRWIEPNRTGFTDEGFFVFSSALSGGPVARLTFAGAGRGWEMECRSGVRAVPLLLTLIDLIMLTRGAVAVHGSAFSYNGAGVLVAGWSRSGKTTSLLAFMARGATYIGDDHVYLRAGGNDIFGLPQPIDLRAWHLSELPAYARAVGWRAHTRLRLFTAMERCASAAASVPATGAARTFAERVAGFAEDVTVSASPERLFGSPALAGTLDKAFLAIAHDRSDVRVEPLDGAALARRLVQSVRSERLRIAAFSLAFRFAFPDEPVGLVEPDEDAEQEALAQALVRSDTYALYHPFPAPVAALHDAMAPIVG